MYINTKIIPAETLLGIGEGKLKESGRGSESKYDIFDTL
jgi:hypothetical protein